MTSGEYSQPIKYKICNIPVHTVHIYFNSDGVHHHLAKLAIFTCLPNKVRCGLMFCGHPRLIIISNWHIYVQLCVRMCLNRVAQIWPARNRKTNVICREQLNPAVSRVDLFPTNETLQRRKGDRTS